MIFHIAVKNFIARGRNTDVAEFSRFFALRMRDINFLQRKLARLELRLDVFDKMQIRFFRVRIVRVARHGDIAARSFLVERGGKFAPVEQPFFQIGGGSRFVPRAFPIGRTAARFAASRLNQFFAEQMFAACAGAIFRTAINSSEELTICDLRFTSSFSFQRASHNRKSHLFYNFVFTPHARARHQPRSASNKVKLPRPINRDQATSSKKSPPRPR